MKMHEAITRLGLPPDERALPEVRALLSAETAKEARAQGRGNTELMRFFCAQLFSRCDVRDVLLIWRAKSASMDAASSIDVQLLCGAGLAETKAYLRGLNDEEARRALASIEESEAAGDFREFSVAEQMGYELGHYAAEGWVEEAEEED